MMLKFITMPVLILITLITVKEGEKNYAVKKISEDLHVTGSGSDPLWKNAVALSDFHYPWENESPPTTTFRALHNETWVYCLFEVKDEQVYLFRDKNDKTEVASSSRAEIFFRIDEKLSPYYCLELDPAGRVFDYKATLYRKFDTEWSWPKDQLIVKTDRTKEGYTVEVAVSKASLTNLGLLKDNTLQAGLYRGDCVPERNGERIFKWISWVIPESETPDFHIPSSFGILTLE